jgi:aminomethyltransferase
MSDSDSLRLSPLDAEHRALGARMVEFGGWDMPIQYRGVLEEHRACREGAVVFDVSHLGSLRADGADVVPALQWAFTNDQLVDLLRSGQGVLNLVPLAPVVQELEAEIHLLGPVGETAKPASAVGE